jgi:hypothetical protein
LRPRTAHVARSRSHKPRNNLTSVTDSIRAIAVRDLHPEERANLPASILWRLGFRRSRVIIGKISLYLIGAFSKLVRCANEKAWISEAGVCQDCPFGVLLELPTVWIGLSERNHDEDISPSKDHGHARKQISDPRHTAALDLSDGKVQTWRRRAQ